MLSCVSGGLAAAEELCRPELEHGGLECQWICLPGMDVHVPVQKHVEVLKVEFVGMDVHVPVQKHIEVMQVEFVDMDVHVPMIQEVQKRVEVLQVEFVGIDVHVQV